MLWYSPTNLLKPVSFYPGELSLAKITQYLNVRKMSKLLTRFQPHEPVVNCNFAISNSPLTAKFAHQKEAIQHYKKADGVKINSVCCKAKYTILVLYNT